MTFYSDLESRLLLAMQADRPRLRNMLRAVRQSEVAGRPFDQNLAKLHEVLEASLALAPGKPIAATLHWALHHSLGNGTNPLAARNLWRQASTDTNTVPYFTNSPNVSR